METKESLMRKSIRWVVYSGIFLIPLWFLPFTFDIAEFNKQVLLIAVAVIVLILFLVDTIRTGVLSYRMSYLYWALLAMLGASAISVASSINRYTSIFGSGSNRSMSLISIIAMIIVVFVAINTIEDKGKVLRRFIAGSLFLTLAFGVLQIFGIFIFKGVFATQAFNTIGSLNSLGLIAALSLVFFLSLGDGEQSRVSGIVMNVIKYAGSILALFIIILINWLILWVITFFGVIAWVYFSSLISDSKNRLKSFITPMMIVVLGIFLIITHFSLTSLKAKFPIEVAPTQSTSYSIAYNIFKHRPLGYGLENFPIAFDLFKPAAIANSVFYNLRFDNAVSEVANFAVEGGVVMVAAFLLLIGLFVIHLVKVLKNSKNNGNTDPSILAVSAMLLFSLFFYPSNLAIVALFIGLLVLSYFQRSQPIKTIDLENSSKYSFLGSVVFIGGLVCVLVMIYFTANNFLSNYYLAKAIETTDNDKSVALFVKSINSNKNDDSVYRALSEKLIAITAQDLKTGPRKGETKEAYNNRLQNSISSAIDLALQATQIAPQDTQNWLNRGYIYQNLIGLVGGSEGIAVDMYNQALAHNPNDPLAYFRIGNIYLTIADSIGNIIATSPKANQNAMRNQAIASLDKAEQAFKASIGLYNNFGQSLYNLAVVYDRKGQLAQAIAQFEQLQKTNPRDPSIVFQLGLLYYRAGKKDSAFAAWQQAVTLFPNYSNARWYLSLSYEEKGDLDNALKQVEEIRKLNPDNDLVKTRITQLQAGIRQIPPNKVLDQQPL